MQTIPALTVKFPATREVPCPLVPSPKPWKVVFQTWRLRATLLAPHDVWLGSKDASPLPPDICGQHQRPDIHCYAVVEVGLPADRLMAQRFPSNKDVVRWLTFDDLLQLVL